MTKKVPAVYIVTNKKNGTLYTGVTSCLEKRIYEHRFDLKEGFSKRHECRILVFFEVHETMESAILREKQLKAGSRKRKITLIQSMNPEWVDLWETLV